MSKPERDQPHIGPDGEVRELDDAFFRRAARGRPRMLPDERKQRVTLYLDRDIIEHFKQEGAGWQTRVNEALSAIVVGRRKAAARSAKRAKAPSARRA